MLTRGGTGRKFIGKKLLVIGGGSVGSLICEEIIKSGILKVDVVDKDILLPENCYRHSCGLRYVNKKKAEAIKTKLEAFYPHAYVNAFSTSIQDALLKRKLDIKQYDAIIVATGNATINQYLNKRFKKEIPEVPVLFSWLDPFGVGGHCLVSNLSTAGCYQCLYSNDNLHNSASFANQTQPKSFSKNISGCGSTYVPYGSLDASQTALLTVRKLLTVLLGKEIKNSISSWKGDAELFLSEGFSLSPRFNQSEQQLEASNDLFYQAKCKVCGTE